MMEATRLRAPAHQAGERQMIGRDSGSDPTVASVRSTNPIRLLLVDDKVIVREGVRAFLEERSGFDVVGQASSIAEAIASDIVADVVITDLVLPDARGRDVVVALRNHFGVPAIFVADRCRPSVAGRGDPLGRRRRIRPEDGHRRRVRLRAEKRRPRGAVSAAVAARRHRAAAPAVDRYSSPGPPPRLGRHTDDEGARSHALARTRAHQRRDRGFCSVSLRTVEARRARVLQKLGVRTRAELVRVANRIGDLEL